MRTVVQVAQPYMPAAHLHDHLPGSEIHRVLSCYQARGLYELDSV